MIDKNHSRWLSSVYSQVKGGSYERASKKECVTDDPVRIASARCEGRRQNDPGDGELDHPSLFQTTYRRGGSEGRLQRTPDGEELQTIHHEFSRHWTERAGVCILQ